MKDYNSLAPQRNEFSWDGASYVARSASAGAARQYREAGLKNSEMSMDDASGVRTLRGLTAAASLEPLLVSLCVFPISQSNGKPVEPVGMDVVDSWPHPLVKELFDWIHSVSGLDDPEDLPGLIKQRDALNKRITALEKKETTVKN